MFLLLNINRIVISYFHSVHNLLKDEYKALFELYWSSSDFAKEIIPQKYLYTQNEFAPLLPTNFDTSQIVISRINDNELAFRDLTKYVITDVPLEYRGLISLKFNHRYIKDSFEMEINSPAYFYIGFLSHYPNPLSDQWEHMGESVTLLEINEQSKVIKVRK